MPQLAVERTPTRFYPDNTRTIAKRFVPAGGVETDGSTRLHRIVGRILGLEETRVRATLLETQRRFSHRHRDFDAVLREGFDAVRHALESPDELSGERQLLIGAYFTHEYSVQAAALCNPSLVVAPDQSELPPGDTAVVMSLRSIGEGHISSIEFRTGSVSRDGAVSFEDPGRYPVIAQRRSARYLKQLFRQKLVELRVYGELAASVLEALPEKFTMGELDAAIGKMSDEDDGASESGRATRALHWLAASNYESAFPEWSQLSERILFPSGPTESSGMEDARFVRFTDDSGEVTYFATYTAYDGYQILPQLIETKDFRHFRMATLNGEGAKNKGLALFPRKVGGRYAALARVDNENNYFMSSDNVHFWHEPRLIQRPTEPWEATHLGNCGSPLETEAGWLVITHGVGPMRQYAIGAILLDLEDPTRVIGTLREPLLEPNQDEREGYVPHVVYSCGSVIVGGRLILPYGFSDSGAGIATVHLGNLLTELKNSTTKA